MRSVAALARRVHQRISLAGCFTTIAGTAESEGMQVLVLCEGSARPRVESEFEEFATVAFCATAEEMGSDGRAADVLVLWDTTTSPAGAARQVHDLRRTRARAPILVVAPRWRRDRSTRVLDAGADDCIVGAYKRPELRARTSALARRSSPPPALPDGPCLCLDPERRTVTAGGRQVHLTRTQFSILEYLVQHRDCWHSPEAIIREVLGTYHQKDSSLVRFHVHKLRSALGETAACIRGERGRGYMFQPPNGSDFAEPSLVAAHPASVCRVSSSTRAPNAARDGTPRSEDRERRHATASPARASRGTRSSSGD